MAVSHSGFILFKVAQQVMLVSPVSELAVPHNYCV